MELVWEPLASAEVVREEMAAIRAVSPTSTLLSAMSSPPHLLARPWAHPQ